MDNAYLKGARVRIEARTSAGTARCPDCGTASRRVHSRYVRTLVDTGIGGRETTLALTVRRLFCDQPSCPRKTFAEQVPGLTTRHGRRTAPAASLAEAVAMALGGRPGARLADRLALPISRTSLIRVIRHVPDPPTATPRVLGVDDSARRRGHRYATILIDMDTHRPIDVLPDREADTLADWLRRHPGVQIICRDRAGAYAEGAARGAPDAIQIADRWHLMHNLSEAVHKVVTQHRRCLQPQPTPPEPAATPPAPTLSGRRADNTRRRHTAVQALIAEGLSIKAVTRRLGMNRGTVRRYARARTPEQLLGPNPTGTTGKLTPFKPYLQARHEQGVTDSQTLYAEIRDRGYRGTLRTLQRFLARTRNHDKPPAPPIPPARHITAWIMRPDDKLTDEDRLGLKHTRAHCPDLDALTELVHGFNRLVRERGGHQIEEWIKQANASPFPELRGFAAGLLKDFDAVRAGLTQPWSSGAVEGNVNRIKMIKRQMYGRANLDLLRKRVLARP